MPEREIIAEKILQENGILEHYLLRIIDKHHREGFTNEQKLNTYVGELENRYETVVQQIEQIKETIGGGFTFSCS